MRTEQEMREALELCQKAKCDSMEGILARDATIETLRYCLGIDDNATSPMTFCFKELLDDMKQSKEFGCKTETNQESESVVTE